jgi:hypothetical protein
MNALKAAFTSYLSHLAAYVIAGATVVSTLNPALMPPKYAFITAVGAAIAAAFSHGKAVQANAGAIAGAMAKAFNDAVSQLPTPAVVIPVPNPAVVVKTAVVLFALCLIGPLLHGCAQLQSFVSSPTGQTVVTAGVGVGVTAAEAKGVTAAQINATAKLVLQYDQGTTASLAALTSAVNAAAIKAGVPAGDVTAFGTLETAFDTYVLVKYGSNATVQTVQTDVASFCNAVIAATGG